MTLRRRQRSWLSRWLIVALLFMQLATASHACSVAFGASAGATVMADMPGCDGAMPATLDPDQPQLCQAHCQQGSHTVNQTPAADLTPAPVLLAVLDWAPAVQQLSAPASRPLGLAAGASPPGAPPLYLALLVLRN
jgi:hypothetical protein